MNTENEPPPRFDHTLTVVDHTMYLIGGRTKDEIQIPFVVKLDFLTRTWMKVELQGYPIGHRYSHSASLVGRDIVVIGGYSRKAGENNRFPITFNVDTELWKLQLLEERVFYPFPGELAQHSAGKYHEIRSRVLSTRED